VVDIAEEVPAFVMGDPGRVRQILTNLVGNAIKFTEGGEVVVTVRPAGAAGGSVEFSIKDTGIGIPTEKLEAIFEEFSQADVSVTRMHGGTGLGLSISRRLVQLMGGTLTVESEIGRGSTFCFVVPLQPGAPHQGFAADRRTVSLEGARILVVDDNETASLIARKTLESVGAIVDEAPSADQGLQLLVDATEQGRPYDAAIIDSMMPVKDGFELASDVEAEPSITGTRLLMLTSAGERAGRRKAEEYGIRGYLNKPVPRSDLIRAVGQVLGLRGPGDGTERRIITEDSLAADRPPASVLLVEDNAVNRLIARKMLEKWGHVVDMAVDGQEAVTKASDGKYDVILMDLQMPVMDGFEATRAILAMERNARVPIIAVTAHALSEERERCEEVGMTGFVTKPYKANELCAAVDGVLRTFSRASIAPGMGEVG
jgi:CheY-like chemotaxis protein